MPHRGGVDLHRPSEDLQLLVLDGHHLGDAALLTSTSTVPNRATVSATIRSGPQRRRCRPPRRTTREALRPAPPTAPDAGRDRHLRSCGMPAPREARPSPELAPVTSAHRCRPAGTATGRLRRAGNGGCLVGTGLCRHEGLLNWAAEGRRRADPVTPAGDRLRWADDLPIGDGVTDRDCADDPPRRSHRSVIGRAVRRVRSLHADETPYLADLYQQAGAFVVRSSLASPSTIVLVVLMLWPGSPHRVWWRGRC